DWFGELAGLARIGTVKPQGTFTFLPPKGKSYTLPEIVDILNEGLESEKEKYILVRRTQSYTVMPADEIAPNFAPPLTVDDLPGAGESELVQGVRPAGTLIAEDLESQFRKLLTPFGDIAVIAPANQFVIRDKVRNLNRITKTIKDAQEGGQLETRDRVCKFIK